MRIPIRKPSHVASPEAWSEILSGLETRLRAARALRGMSQSELARKCGLHPSHIAHFEAGRRVPSLGHFKRLCNGLGANAGELLGTNED